MRGPPGALCLEAAGVHKRRGLPAILAASTMTTSATPTIRLLHHLARTGGTVISKCLACMDRVVLLSEIHPAGVRFDNMNPLNQAQDWFQLLTSADMTMLRQRGSLPFAEAIRLVHARAAERGCLLVIRDWTHLDFTGVPYVARPPYVLGLPAALRGSFEILHVATVRHPIDQWLSLRRLAATRGVLDLPAFLYGYRRFAELCPAMGFVRYEDFVVDPEAVLARLCRALALPYDAGFRQRWAGYTRITGDGSTRSTEIRLRPRPAVEDSLLAAFAGNRDYRDAIELLGYGHPA